MNNVLGDIEASRTWLKEHCHHSAMRRRLIRSVDYLAAMERAGLSTDAINGDDLYEFLTDANAAAARSHAFIQATL